MVRVVSELRERAVGPSSTEAISANALSKTFRLALDEPATLRQRVLHPFAARSDDAIAALRDVSFEIRRGEFFGVVGKNGSGKSTLLKCLAGIYRPDAGSVHADGRIAPFIELGVGFNHELAARDNVVMNAIMLGLSPREARARFDEIIAFAELEDFLALKLKNYSSGMLVRLAFSVTVQVGADILLFDEVLAVGDASFQQKCYRRFDSLKADGRTIVLVTHDMETVTRFCDRAMLLHEGEVVTVDDPRVVARDYEQLNLNPAVRLRAAHAPPVRHPRPSAERRSAGAVTRTLRVAWQLALHEFKLRYFDSALSYAWSVLRPLAYFAVLYLFVTQLTGLSRGVRHYPAYLFTAVMLWSYFEQTASTALYCLVHHQDLLRKVPIPRLSLPLAVLLGAFLDLCANLVAVLVVLLASGILPRLTWLELPLLIAALTLLAAGVSLLLSALYVRLRDLDQIWTVASQALFLGTPIFYVLTKFSPSIQHAMLTNPLAVVFTQMRHAVIDPHAPTALALGGAGPLLVAAAIGAAVVAAGAALFRYESPRVVESL